jgi:Ca-activated chloride channel family protein
MFDSTLLLAWLEPVQDLLGLDVSVGELQWLWPWVFWLLPLPLLGYLLPAARSHQQQAVAVPFWADVSEGTSAAQGTRWYWKLFALLMWLALLVSAARPQYVGEIVQVPLTGRDLLLAVDISGSMDTADMPLARENITRLTAVKAIAGEFIKRRSGDRTGLILFGDRAYLQVPLTFDRSTTTTVLRDAQIGLAGKKTAIGDAIGLAVKRMRESEEKATGGSEEQVLILLTDGANSAGALDPLQATEFAEQAGMTIYTIGIGADRLVVNGRRGSRVVNPSTDLDEKTLTDIADRTGGRYFRARDPQQLNQIYEVLDELEPVAEDEEIIRPITELFHWPLGLVMALTLLMAIGSGLIAWLQQYWAQRAARKQQAVQHG